MGNSHEKAQKTQAGGQKSIEAGDILLNLRHMICAAGFLRPRFILRWFTLGALAAAAVSCTTLKLQLATEEPLPSEDVPMPQKVPQEDVGTFMTRARAYANGVNGATNEIEAVKWYRKAADLGNAEAMNALGKYYCGGKGGLPRDMGEGFRQFQKAAALNYAPAQTALALCYTSGLGTKIDFTEAQRWFRAAAEQGDADAQAFLGLLLRDGKDVPQDLPPGGEMVPQIRRARQCARPVRPRPAIRRGPRRAAGPGGGGSLVSFVRRTRQSGRAILSR